MDAIDVLIGDHNRVRGLFARLDAAKQAGDEATTAAVAEQIVAELEAHTTIEEEIFYPETRTLSQGINETTAEGLEEHHVVQVLLDEIKELEPGSETWTAKLQVVVENVEHHADEEESELFPKIRSHSSTQQREEIGARLEARKKELGAPTSADAQGMSKSELADLASEQQIPGRSKMDLDELVRTVDARSS